MTDSPSGAAPLQTTGTARSQTVSEADRCVAEAAEAGVAMQTLDDVEYDGRHVEIDGSRLLNFGCCSYLALEQRPELKQGAIRAIERFGTQFSFSRVYLQSPLYPKLEDAVGRMTGGYVLVAPTTTLAHLAALPVLVEAGDAVLVDKFAHASVHMATALLQANPVHTMPHNRMDLLEEKIAVLTRTHRRIWYLIDGLYSMLGDFAPIDRIAALLEKYPQLHLYVDDAHCTSWIGKSGRGYALDRLPDRSRVVVALGFAKAFSVGGAALVFSTDEDRMRVRRCGGPMLFSGPLQPPLLGAALASAELQLRPDFSVLQQDLLDRIEQAHALANQRGIRFASQDHSPIFFIRCGPESRALALTKRMREQGLYVCVAVFPAVPRNQSGVRFTISLHNTPADIDCLIAALSAEVNRLGISATTNGHPVATKNESGERIAVRPSKLPAGMPKFVPIPARRASVAHGNGQGATSEPPPKTSC
jgi:7-keto-8-aminopelargonate synthetase-like enzyme